MRILRVFLAVFVALAMVGVQSADAQFGGLGKKLKNKVKEKVEDEAEERVEQRVDRAMDSAVDGAVNSVADGLESSIEGFFLSQAPEPIELGDNATGDPNAPFVKYTTVSRVKLLGGGAPGLGGMEALLNRFGATKESMYTHGGFQRSDDENSSEIRDAEGKRYIHIDHDEKTYYVMEIADLMAPMEALSERGMPSMEAPGMEMSEQAVRESKVTVDRRDGVETVNGVPSRRIVTVVESPNRMTTTDPETGETVTVDNKTFVVVDVWHSTEMAGYNTIRSFERQMAEAIMSSLDPTAMGDLASTMKGVAPGMQEAMQEAYAELGNVEGMVVKESVHVVPAPPDAELDVEAILAESATEATSMEPGQLRPMYTFMTEIGDLTTEPFDLSVFSPPADYREVESPMKQAMEMLEEGK